MVPGLRKPLLQRTFSRRKTTAPQRAQRWRLPDPESTSASWRDCSAWPVSVTLFRLGSQWRNGPHEDMTLLNCIMGAEDFTSELWKEDSPIVSQAHLQEIHFLWRPFLSDANDDMVLELAFAARCGYI